MGDEAALDSLDAGRLDEPVGVVAIHSDFYPITPEAISEVNVLASTYMNRNMGRRLQA